MNSSPLKVAIIGCGNWGKNLIRVFHQLGALGAVCDNNPIKAAHFSEAYQVPAYSLDKICELSAIDGLVVATPSVTHAAIALKGLFAQKHVFIEKPFTMDTQSALQLKQVAQTEKRQIMIGHLLQYHPLFTQLKMLTQKGVFGRLQYLSSSRCHMGKFYSEKSVLWDFSPHDISMILSLVKQMPTQIDAKAGHFLTHTTMDNVSLHLDFPNNIKAHIFASWLHPYKEQKLIVVGEKAMAIFDDCQPWENKLRVIHYPSEWNDGLPHPFNQEGERILIEKSEPLLNECAHFLECIQTNQPPITDGNEALRVITVLEAAEKAIAAKSPGLRPATIPRPSLLR